MHFHLTYCTIIVCGLQFVPTISVLVIARFLLGIFSAHYMALAPNLIKDHLPDRLWKPYGALYEAMRITGMLLCYLFGPPYIGGPTNIPLFLGPVVISGVQAIVLYFLLP